MPFKRFRCRDKHLDPLTIGKCPCDQFLHARIRLLSFMADAVLIKPRSKAVGGQADVHDKIVDDEGIGAGFRGAFASSLIAPPGSGVHSPRN